ncbi:MAG: hypothetical protein HYU36_03320 [Planctomycetes bacterium]|nr:hypothetical protein [Planctomycetota bacterium]
MQDAPGPGRPPLAESGGADSDVAALESAASRGLDLMTFCGSCALRLEEARKNRMPVDRPAEGDGGDSRPPARHSARVLHLLDMLAPAEEPARLRKFLYRPLRGIRAAIGISGLETSDQIQALGSLIRTCEAEVIPGTLETADPTESRRPSTAQFLRQAMGARDQEADCMVTLTPWCHGGPDFRPGSFRRRPWREFPLPLLHLAQFAGLALGLEPIVQLGLGHGPASAAFLLGKLPPSPLLGGDPILIQPGDSP